MMSVDFPPQPSSLALAFCAVLASVEDGMAVARKPEGERKVLWNLAQRGVESSESVD